MAASNAESFLEEELKIGEHRQIDMTKVPEDSVWGGNFLPAYISSGNERSFNNNHLHIGLALALVGQALGDSHFYSGDNQENVRVHPMIIQGSGTGKDPAFSFAQRVANEAGMKMRDTNDVTEAGLIGTIRDGEKNEGVARSADIIGFREATTLFRSATQEYNSTLGENINQIMDGNEVQREMAEGSISYNPTCTLVGTSYEPKDLDLERLMNNGTLARFFYFFRPKDDQFRWDMGETFVEKAVEPTDHEQRVHRFNKLANTIGELNQAFEDEKEFEIDEKVAGIDLRDHLREIYQAYSIGTQKIVEPAVTRYHVHFLRVSCLFAALDYGSTLVTKRHADRALKIIEESWDNLLTFYANQSVTGTKEQALTESEVTIVKTLHENGELSQKELAENVGVTKRTIRNRSTKLSELGLLEARKEGKEKRYVIPTD